MAKKTRRGQKQCPSCKAWIKGPRAKSCSKCGYSFNGAAAPETAPAIAAAGSTITIEQIRAVSETVKASGGVGRLNQTLALIREVGGAKKFKELVEAMGITE